MLQDIAVLTGGQLISKKSDLALMSPRYDGVARKVTIDKEPPSLPEVKPKLTCKAIGQIRSQLEETDSDYDQENFKSGSPNSPVELR